MPLVLSIIGLILLLLSVLADPLGIGAASDVFGWRQIFAAGAGAVLLVVGLLWQLRRQGRAQRAI